MVPSRDGREAPGVHEQQVRQQRRGRQDVGVDVAAGHHRGHAKDADGGQADQVQRIDPRQPGPQELAVVEAALFGAGQVDVAQDEAREDEEHLHPKVALGDDGRGEPHVQAGPEGEEHDPGRGEEAEGGERLQMFGLHGDHVSIWRRRMDAERLRAIRTPNRRVRSRAPVAAGVSPRGAWTGIQPWPVNTPLSRPPGDA